MGGQVAIPTGTAQRQGPERYRTEATTPPGSVEPVTANLSMEAVSIDGTCVVY